MVVLGAGPAGLAAALTLARAGIAVSVIEAGTTVGGLCVTTRQDDVAYDLGGHILFVRSPSRESWLRELLGQDLIHVDRPVASLVDGDIRRGRYFDQAGTQAASPPAMPGPELSAAEYLRSIFPEGAVLTDVRQYMEKVDGVSIDAITGQRCHKLFAEQYAPEGWWYPANGVGQLMDAMERAIVAGRGEVLTEHRVERITVDGDRVQGVRVAAPDGTVTTLAADAVIAGIPPALVLRLLDVPSTPIDLPARAAAVVVLAVDRDRLSEEPWIQVGDPSIPFARLAEPKNWSPRLAPSGRTVVTGEVYCSPTPDDPWWGRSDEDLAEQCRDGLVRMGLLAATTPVQTLDVLRRSRAWSIVTTDRVRSVTESLKPLGAVAGLVTAQGGDVVQAIEMGEQAAITVGSALTQ